MESFVLKEWQKRKTIKKEGYASQWPKEQRSHVDATELNDVGLWKLHVARCLLTPMSPKREICSWNGRSVDQIGWEVCAEKSKEIELRRGLVGRRIWVHSAPHARGSKQCMCRLQAVNYMVLSSVGSTYIILSNGNGGWERDQVQHWSLALERNMAWLCWARPSGMRSQIWTALTNSNSSQIYKCSGWDTNPLLSEESSQIIRMNTEKLWGAPGSASLRLGQFKTKNNRIREIAIFSFVIRDSGVRQTIYPNDQN